MDLFSFDGQYRKQGYQFIAGIDEAGRGPWAGPVVAATVVLSSRVTIDGLNDSKKLSPRKREKLFDEICAVALSVGIEIVSHEIIDTINILQATYQAMRGSLLRIRVPIDCALVDGWAIPDLEYPQIALVGGDGLSASIAAASIVAKVTRDRLMTELSPLYPEYHFHQHKGYGTPEHLAALRLHGPCAIHRKSIAPIRECSGKNTVKA
jgi:ribonuclease HII